MAKKVLLQDINKENILPITRGELVLDSSGNLALHSNEFLATDSLPGLTPIHYVEVSSNSPSNNARIILLQIEGNDVYPVTSSDSVMVNVGDEQTTLTTFLGELETSKIILDDRPTEGNTTHSVSSDGIFQELKETVGNIHILLTQI